MGFFKRFLGLGSTRPTGAAAADSAALPSPPAGFSWHTFQQARMTVLRPDEWYVHQAGNDQSFTGCISKECVQTEGSFKTGLTLLVFRGVKEGLRKRNPDYDQDVAVAGIFHSRHGETFFSDSCNRVLYCDQMLQRNAHSRLFRFQYRQALLGKPPIIVQKFLIDFDQSSDVYEFIFESPESSWDQSWQKGKQILTNLVFCAGPSKNLVFSADPPLPPGDLLYAKTLEAGNAMGWSKAYENPAEGLFIWRVKVPAPVPDAARTFGGCFAWYMKRVENEIWVHDPVQFAAVDGSAEVMEQLTEEARGLQENFKRRWLALVGPVTLRGASPEIHKLELLMSTMADLLQPRKES